jgi:hypothetical protein
MANRGGSHSHFRLSFEQQRKRAKDLLKAASAGDERALARFRAAPKLAEAQYLVAQELRFADWAQLKLHIAAMERERERIATHRPTPSAAPDGDVRTLHVRCGSDIRERLLEAGFSGDFYEHSYPYLHGPVTEGPGCLEQRARFIVDTYDDIDGPMQYTRVLEQQLQGEQQLADSAGYERVVIWSEFDCYDQLVLARLLAHYASHGPPRLLELINVDAFPGTARFLGLGQLPPEALRLLWKSRKPATQAQLEVGFRAWKALANDDPRDLAKLARSGTPPLPLLAIALHRHLSELPSVKNGLSFTEQMALQLLSEGQRSLDQIFRTLTFERDPLPGQGDLQIRDRVLDMERASDSVFERHPSTAPEGATRRPWTDVLTITNLGREVLAGTVDFLSLHPPPRWVGGVEVNAAGTGWRWDESASDAVWR